MRTHTHARAHTKQEIHTHKLQGRIQGGHWGQKTPSGIILGKPK